MYLEMKHRTIVSIFLALLFTLASSDKTTASLTNDQIEIKFQTVFDLLSRQAAENVQLRSQIVQLKNHIEKQDVIIEHLNGRLDKLMNLNSKVTEINIKNRPTETISKTIPLRTCLDIRSSDPSATSGYYYVDPDGQQSGDDPIIVFCNMTDGSTMVPHDSESAIQATSCLDPGCYSRPIIYSATMRQMLALIQLSQSCRQFIAFDCNAVPFEFNSVPQAWWTDRAGVARYHWAGSNSSVHTCQCGLDDNCALTSLKCNCDSVAGVALRDQGYLTNQDQLPVAQLNFGRTIVPSSYGVHTLGKFECSGRTQVSGMPTSCADLWQIGNTLTGFYTIKGTNTIQSVYCDFTKLPGDQGLQTLIGDIDVKSSNVHFSVQLRTSFNSANSTIPFERVISNPGDGLDMNGTYTAPKSGAYLFSFDSLSNDVTTNIDLYVNNAFQSVSSSGSGSGAQTMSQSVILTLKQGDQVKLVLRIGSLNSGFSSTFNGFLLQEQLTL